MSTFLFSLMAQYRRNPGQAFKHLKKITGLISTGRLSDVVERFRTHSKTHRDIAEVNEKLQAFARNEAAQAGNLVDWVKRLAPQADWPPLTGDPLHDLKAVIRAIYEDMGLFDPDFYRAVYMADVDEAETLSPIEHFMLYGRYSGFSPNAYFDYTGYLVQYPDIVEHALDPCLHYTHFGWLEARNPGGGFDALSYLRRNADVAAAELSPLHHFMAAGRFEGRSPVPGEAAAVVSTPSAFGGEKGTIVLVSHDAGVGGAQKVVQSLARWIRDRTSYDVRLVTMKGGGLLHDFVEIAPTLNIADHDPETLAAALEDFCGPDVRAVFLNSISSGGFLKYWNAPTPVLSYIHELQKLLGAHPEELNLIHDRATTVIAGSEAVRTTLRDMFQIPAERLEVVHGFIDGEVEIEDLTAKAAAKAALDIAPDTRVVAACGVLHWRKSPEIFIEVAAQVLAETRLPVQFIWVGGGPDHEACEALIREKGVQDRVTITGYAEDVQPYLDAADIFLLPSEEDPFPLVCLMAAQALSPIICFDEAGGMPELVRQGCGEVVPFLDAGAMARATLEHLNDDALRLERGQVGQKLVRERYTITTTGPLLFSHIRQAAKLRPAVSVVLPNYNYEAYLPQRLETIAAQTFQDFEILLLDDKSTDGSVELMRRWAASRPAVRLVPNEENSGSPFAQWIKGMEMAESDLIWMAEADDFCEPTLLATLLPAFDDRNVYLGYVKSVPVNSAGEVQGDYEPLYLDRINPGRWSEPYIVTDHEEASAGLGIANCIPNGSSVIFRRFRAEESFRRQVTSMRMCGDWLYYLRAMRGGLVAYANAPLNYHRRHGDTVTSQTEGSPMYFDELQTVRDYVQAHYRLTDEAQKKIATFTTQDLDRFDISDADRRARVMAGVARTTAGKDIPSVLFVASDLSPGGGQMFVIRLANAWVARGGRAVLLNAGYSATHPKVLTHIDPRVTLIREGDPQARDLADLCARFDIDLIHSSIWWADKYVRNQIENLPDMPWVTTMHGCYETHLEHPRLDVDFSDDYRFMRDRINCWVHIADKNTRVFDVLGHPGQHMRIENGVPDPSPRQLGRAELGLREDAIVLCLVSRGIEEKGWLEAVEMTRALNDDGMAVDLMLVGDGPVLEQIRPEAPPYVHLYGHVDNVDELVAACDIGILPSFFVGESMPLVLLEMMALGKPIVATDVGEIPEMLGHGQGAAGIVVPNAGDRLDVDAFRAALQALVKDSALRETYSGEARRKFLKSYNLENMVSRYKRLYQEHVDKVRQIAQDTVNS